MFTLTISTDNDAFGEDAALEVARILHSIADDLPERGLQRNWPIRDVNGNNVGSWTLSAES